MPTTTLPPQRVILSLPSLPALGLIILSSSGTDQVVVKALTNLKRSSGHTIGGGLKVNRAGNFASKAILTVNALIKDLEMATRYRELMLLQQDLPYLGQVVLTDQKYQVNQRETALNARSIVPGTTATVAGVPRSEVAYKVVLQLADDEADIIRPVGHLGWAIDFIATEV